MSANRAKTGFMQTAKVPHTRSMKTCRKLNGSSYFAEKGIADYIQEFKFFKRYMDDIVCTARGAHYITLSMKIPFTRTYNSILRHPGVLENW